MSRVLGDHDGEAPLDVPSIMKMLMVVYNNVRDDQVMDEVAEAVADAICMLGDMRTLAQQIATENAQSDPEIMADFAALKVPSDTYKLC